MLVEEAVEIAAPADRVWQALVDPQVRAEWWGYLVLDARVGGRFEEHWTAAHGQVARTAGQVTELTERRLLRLDWADDDWDQPTEVEVQLRPTEKGTVVQLRHTGWERLPDGAALAAEHREGWRLHLANLRRCVETAQ